MRLSVIVPIYNTENYLCQCIESILAQTFDDLELILVNDGSTDKCGKICEEYKNKDNRVKVIHQENGGYINARRAGLKIAAGDFVGYVDSDDWIEPNMYEHMINAVDETNAEIVMCDVLQSFSKKENRISQTIKPGFYDKQALINYVYPIMIYSGGFYSFGVYPALWNKIFKRELLLKNQYNMSDKIRLGEDAVCTYPCLLDAESIYYLNYEYLYHYRQSISQTTLKYDGEYFNRFLILYDNLNKIFSDKNIYDLSNQLEYYYSYIIKGAIDNEFLKENNKRFKDKIFIVKYIIKHKIVIDIFNRLITKPLPKKYRLFMRLIKHKAVYAVAILEITRNFFKNL